MDKVKLSDIAKATGVSASTVSLVFNNRPGIPVETRRRILEAAEKLGYRSERFQALLSGSLLKRAGLVLRVFEEEPSQINPFYSVIISGIEAACRQNQTQLVYSHLHVDINNRPVEPLRVDEVDGLILVGIYVPEGFIQTWRNRPIPIVLVDGYSENDRYDAVVSRNFAASYEGVKHLIGLGHRNIGMLAIHKGSYPSLDERRAGYHEALLDHGITKPYIRDCFLRTKTDEYRQAARALLTDHPEISAVFCALDIIAVEVVNASRELGRRIPEDLAVVGFDGIDMSGMVQPSITTLSLNQFSMGQLAVRLLYQRAQNPQFPQVLASLSYQLVERESTRTKFSSERR